jgi:hypothetical protein
MILIADLFILQEDRQMVVAWIREPVTFGQTSPETNDLFSTKAGEKIGTHRADGNAARSPH